MNLNRRVFAFIVILFFIILPTVCAISVSLNPQRITVRAIHLTEVRYIVIGNPGESSIRVNLTANVGGVEVIFGSNNFEIGIGGSKSVPITFKMGRQGDFRGEILITITDAHQHIGEMIPVIELPVEVNIYARNAVPCPQQIAAQQQSLSQQQVVHQRPTRNIDEQKELVTKLPLPAIEGALLPVPAGIKQIPQNKTEEIIKQEIPQNKTNETNISYIPNQEIEAVNEIFGITHTQLAYGIAGILGIAAAAFAYKNFDSKILSKTGKNSNKKSTISTQEKTQPSINKKVWK